MMNGIVQLGSLVTPRRYRRADLGMAYPAYPLGGDALHPQDRSRRVTQ